MLRMRVGLFSFDPGAEHLQLVIQRLFHGRQRQTEQLVRHFETVTCTESRLAVWCRFHQLHTLLLRRRRKPVEILPAHGHLMQVAVRVIERLQSQLHLKNARSAEAWSWRSSAAIAMSQEVECGSFHAASSSAQIRLACGPSGSS